MQQAADLFRITSSSAFASDLTARQLIKPAGPSTSGSPRFDDLLSKASQRPSETSDNSSENEDESDVAAKRSDQDRDRDRASASRGKSKTDKSHKAKPRKVADAKKDADPKAEESEETDATAKAPTDDDSSAKDSTDDDSGDDSSDESKPKDAPPQTDPSLLAQSPVHVEQPLAAAAQPTVTPKMTTAAGKADADPTVATLPVALDRPKATVQKQAVATQLTSTDKKPAAKANDDQPQDADPTAPADIPPPLAPKPGVRPVDSHKADSSANAASAADASDSSSSAAAPQDLSAITGNPGFEQLASLFDDIESAAADEKSGATKETTSATPSPSEPITAGYIPSAHEPTVTQSADNPPVDATPEARFAEQNHQKIVSGVHGELLPNGGTMKLRLDPPELGTLSVSLHMRDGVVSASFQTANGDAAQLLSHTLSDLRSTLEAHGITVDKLHVQQSPREDSDSGTGKDDSQSRSQSSEQQQDARREQQRKDMVQKLWDRLSGLAPIDLVA